MIWFVVSVKFYFFLVCASSELSAKMVFFRGFTNFFFRSTGLQLKLLILIEFSNIFQWKPGKNKVSAVLRGCSNHSDFEMVKQNV